MTEISAEREMQKTCRKCGSCRFSAKSGRCMDCAKALARRQRLASPEKTREASARYKAKNREKVKEYQKVYYQDNAADFKLYAREYYAGNKNRYLELAKIYYRENADKIRARESSIEGRALKAARSQRWASKNKDKRVINENARRARKRNAPGRHSAEDLKNIFKMQRGKCGYCKRSITDKYTVDHIVPLAKGGSNFPSNIQLLCGLCNSSKKDLDPVVYAQRLGKLI